MRLQGVTSDFDIDTKRFPTNPIDWHCQNTIMAFDHHGISHSTKYAFKAFLADLQVCFDNRYRKERHMYIFGVC
jgi:hypothetical protein